jgi:hypothetical protein
MGVAKEAVKDCTKRVHRKHWDCTVSNRKSDVQRSLLPKEKLLQVNRNQLMWVVELVTGHYHVSGYLG